jgi:ribosomal protein S18 acetylase RimI-like enzyme
MAALIRPATEADTAGIAEVQVRTWQKAYAGLLPAEQLDGMSVERSHRGWASRLATLAPNGALLVADLDGEIAGFVSCGPSLDEDAPPDRGQIYAIYVRAAHWRAGIGRQLNDAALESLRANGFRAATLWVLRANTRACDFYTTVGWVADGAEQSEEIHGMTADEIRYVRPVN